MFAGDDDNDKNTDTDHDEGKQIELSYQMS